MINIKKTTDMNHWVINCFLRKQGATQRRNFQIVSVDKGQVPTRESILAALAIDESRWEISGEVVDVMGKERVVRYECRLEKKQS
jgi:hypothetical protein